MRDNKTKRLRILSHIIVGYMLLALVWWAILLISKNKEAYLAQAELIQLQHEISQDPDLARSLETLKEDFQKQRYMIMGEGVVFAIALLFGIWFINRGYAREIDTIRQKRNFLLAITHELKSPLASIRLILDTFQKRNLDEKDRKQLSYHGISETERLSTLINNLLLSARLDKAYEPMWAMGDIRETIHSVVTDIEKTQTEVAVGLDLPSQAVTVMYDSSGMYSVLYNLVENSLKYGGKENEIVVRLTDHDKTYSIQVEDQGPGIPPRERERIFEQFYRTGQEDTRSTKGTGIGLYIADKIVKLHGGKIKVRDNLPQGTIMELILPKKVI